MATLRGQYLVEWSWTLYPTDHGNTFSKMLRVYYIFAQFKTLKPGIFTSNCALAVYTHLMLSPNVAVLTTWSIVDPFYDEIQYSTYPGFSEAVERYQCKSNHEFIWFGLLLTFFIILSTAVVAVAIKTRKIRMMHFKDTKKVNLLIFLLFFIVSFTLSYWLFFTGFYDHAVFVILCVGNLVAAFLCQIILFLPKVWPPLKKKLYPKRS